MSICPTRRTLCGVLCPPEPHPCAALGPVTLSLVIIIKRSSDGTCSVECCVDRNCAQDCRQANGQPCNRVGILYSGTRIMHAAFRPWGPSAMMAHVIPCS